MATMFKSKFKRRAPLSDEMSLQITSMADIFTILLVFLLKGYGSSAMSLTPAKGLILPEAQAAEAQVEALRVEITDSAVLLEGNPVSELRDRRFAASELQGNGTAKSLLPAFEKERKRQLLIAKSNSDVHVDPKLIVVSDQHVPYGTLKAVLASAAVNGYTDFKLAVVNGGSTPGAQGK